MFSLKFGLFWMLAGSPSVLATFFLSPLVGGGVMAVVFPIVSFKLSLNLKSGGLQQLA